MHLRIIVPNTKPTYPLPVVYLLHGAGQDYRDWSNHSDIAAFSAQGFVLVMPDEANAYYINEASGDNRRYEDYFVNDVIPEVHRVVHNAAWDRAHNAIVGISRGGYGAVILALKHPELFTFVGDLSGAIDFPERRFRWHAPLASYNDGKVFGAMGSETRRDNDPFLLIHQVLPRDAPYFFVTCGDKDSLFQVNQRFATSLAARHLPFEFHTAPGGHNWGVWSAILPTLKNSLLEHIGQREGH